MVSSFPQNDILDEDARLFKSWASVEIRDDDGEVVPVNELGETMEKWFARGAPISDGDHSDKIIGKGHSWGYGVEPKSKQRGMWIIGEVYKNQKYDDEVWAQTKSGERRGMSWSGRYHKVEKSMINGVPAHKLHDLETYAFALCQDPKNDASYLTNVNFKASSGDGKKGEDMPFAGYKNFAACVKANQSKSDPDAYCAVIMRKVEDSSKAGGDEEILRTFFSGRSYTSLDKEERDEFEKIRRAYNRVGDIETAKSDMASHLKEEKQSFEKERKEHPEFTDEQTKQIVEDHEHEKLKSADNQSIVKQKSSLAGEKMDGEKTKAEEATPTPQPQAGGPAEVISLLKEILARLPARTGGGMMAEEANKADLSGPGKKLEAAPEGGKVKLPESVGDKTTQESPDKKVSADKLEIPQATMKAIKDTVAAELDSRFSHKSATPRPDSAAPADMESNYSNPNPGAQPSLGLAIDVAQGRKKLTFQEIERMGAEDRRARRDAAITAIRKQAAGAKKEN